MQVRREGRWTRVRGGCHDSRDEALAHLGALRANVEKIAEGEIRKVDAERRLAFGWAYVAVAKDGTPVEDHSGDVLDPDTLEDPVYDYVLHSREGDAMHTGPVAARMVESVVFTADKLEKMGLADGTVPIGWWVGFKVDDDAVWKAVKAGRLTMFSIGGRGARPEADA
ncbi:MAG: XkdF-like putative serine protease domain-containing protein [Gemmatimonadota bacterium]